MSPIVHGDSEAVFKFIEEWERSLVDERYSDACDMLHKNPMLLDQWTPELIENLITTNGRGDTSGNHRVTSAAKMEVHEAERENLKFEAEEFIGAASVHSRFPWAVYWSDEPDVVFREDPKPDIEIHATAEMTYALDGEWSQLSSVFQIFRIDDDHLAVGLERIEVM